MLTAVSSNKLKLKILIFYLLKKKLKNLNFLIFFFYFFKLNVGSFSFLLKNFFFFKKNFLKMISSKNKKRKTKFKRLLFKKKNKKKKRKFFSYRRKLIKSFLYFFWIKKSFKFKIKRKSKKFFKKKRTSFFFLRKKLLKLILRLTKKNQNPNLKISQWIIFFLKKKVSSRKKHFIIFSRVFKNFFKVKNKLKKKFLNNFCEHFEVNHNNYFLPNKVDFIENFKKKNEEILNCIDKNKINVFVLDNDTLVEKNLTIEEIFSHSIVNFTDKDFFIKEGTASIEDNNDVNSLELSDNFISDSNNDFNTFIPENLINKIVGTKFLNKKVNYFQKKILLKKKKKKNLNKLYNLFFLKIKNII